LVTFIEMVNYTNWTTVNDHDFESLSGEVASGLYDIFNNIGYITLSTATTLPNLRWCIRNWWLTYGIVLYPIATSILLLCDGGGSNSSRHYIFKEDLQKLSEDIGIEIRIAHYPPYTSKYNPIEHRLFPHITRACKGIIFKSVKIVNEVISKTTTSTGLKVFTSIMDKVFNKGRKVTDGFKENMTIRFHDFLPQWNYSAMPLQTSTLVGY